jgi:hypothetical protein
VPKLTDTYVKRPQRLLIVGDPSAGKTTAVGHLLEHGQKLFVADFDAKLNPITKHVPAKFHDALVYSTLVDKMKLDASSGYAVPIGKPTAFPKFMRLIDRWVDDDGTDYGEPVSWDANTWLVIDSLTTMGGAVLRWVKADRGVSGKKTSGPTLGEAIARVTGVVETFLGFPINIIMLAHLSPVSAAEKDSFGGDDTGDKAIAQEKAEMKHEALEMSPHKYIRYPYTIGKQLPRTIGGLFTAVVYAKTVGTGPRAQKVLSTVPDEDVQVNVPVGNKALPPEVPLNGLYTIIESMRRSVA